LTLAVFLQWEADHHMFITSNLHIPLENTLGRSAVMSCEGELLLLCKTEFSLVFSLVVVHTVTSQACCKQNT
jgi:hypothetical protein